MSQEFLNKVLFVAGPGRSGSTLLDMLLGQIDGFCSTGELRFIWERGFRQNQLCGCGAPFRECSFWTEVVEEAFGGFQNVDHERFDGLRHAAERQLDNGSLVNGDSGLLASYQEYFDAYGKIYSAIRKISGCEFIVDSSKKVANGFILACTPNIELFTIHLIRDSRAVAYSWQRAKLRPEIYWERTLMSPRGILKSSVRWNSRNRSAHKLQMASKGYTALKYEDLASNPRESLRRLFADLGIALPSLDFLNGLHANLKISHTVSGNPVRFARQELKIQPDVEWKKGMASYQKWLVTLLTWPLLWKYGYLKDNNSNKKTAEFVHDEAGH